jgi:type IV pilus assembly protein PilF
MRKILVGIVFGLVVLQLVACQQPGVRNSEKRDLASTYVQMGVVYMQEDRLDIALDKFQRALELDSTYSPAHNGIAILYNRLGENDNAERHFRKAIKHDPKNSGSLNNYGGFLCEQGRYAEAEEKFIAAVSNPLYRSPASALTNAGVCAGRIPDLEKAESYFRHALDHNARYPLALLRMSALSLHKENYMSARGYMQRYQEVAQFSAESLWIAVQIEYALGNKDAAASYTLLLKNNFPNTIQTKQLLGWENERRARH